MNAIIKNWILMSCFTVGLAFSGWLATGRWRDFLIIAIVFIVFHPVYLLVCSHLNARIEGSRRRQAEGNLQKMQETHGDEQAVD